IVRSGEEQDTIDLRVAVHQPQHRAFAAIIANFVSFFKANNNFSFRLDFAESAKTFENRTRAFGEEDNILAIHHHFDDLLQSAALSRTWRTIHDDAAVMRETELVVVFLAVPEAINFLDDLSHDGVFKNHQLVGLGLDSTKRQT